MYIGLNELGSAGQTIAMTRHANTFVVAVPVPSHTPSHGLVVGGGLSSNYVNCALCLLRLKTIDKAGAIVVLYYRDSTFGARYNVEP